MLSYKLNDFQIPTLYIFKITLSEHHNFSDGLIFSENRLKASLYKPYLYPIFLESLIHLLNFNMQSNRRQWEYSHILKIEIFFIGFGSSILKSINPIQDLIPFPHDRFSKNNKKGSFLQNSP